MAQHPRLRPHFTAMLQNCDPPSHHATQLHHMTALPGRPMGARDARAPPRIRDRTAANEKLARNWKFASRHDVENHVYPISPRILLFILRTFRLVKSLSMNFKENNDRNIAVEFIIVILMTWFFFFALDRFLEKNSGQDLLNAVFRYIRQHSDDCCQRRIIDLLNRNLIDQKICMYNFTCKINIYFPAVFQLTLKTMIRKSNLSLRRT